MSNDLQEVFNVRDTVWTRSLENRPDGHFLIGVSLGKGPFIVSAVAFVDDGQELYLERPDGSMLTLFGCKGPFPAFWFTKREAEAERTSEWFDRLPAEDQEKVKAALHSISEVMEKVAKYSKTIIEARKILKGKGFLVDVAHGISMSLDPERKLLLPAAPQYVQNGDVVADLFNTEFDQNFLKTARLKLSDEC